MNSAVNNAMAPRYYCAIGALRPRWPSSARMDSVVIGRPDSASFTLGHLEPELGEQAGAVWVRFLPSGYIAAHRVAHDLTARRREIFEIVAHDGATRQRDIMERMADPPASASVRDDRNHLRRLNLLDSSGQGRGAVWFLEKDEAWWVPE